MTNLEKHACLIKTLPIEKITCYINRIRTRNRPCFDLSCRKCWEESIDWLLKEAEGEE